MDDLERLRLSRIRNIGIIAHVDGGKTSLTEAMLFNAGETHKMGKVDDGNTQMDKMPQEQEKGITISSACTTFNWNVDSDKLPHLKDQ